MSLDAGLPGLVPQAPTAGVAAADRGGTGLEKYNAGNYLRAANEVQLEQRTPAQVLSDIGAAPASHTHHIDTETTGSLPPSRIAQSGANTGQVLKWNGTAWAPANDLTGGAGQDPIQFQDEGNNLGSPGDVATVNFTGAGVTATYSSGTLTVSIPGGGSGTFTGLTDTPADYTGAAGRMLRVNATEDALEFRTPSQVLSDIGAAASSHTHSAADITSGTLSVARGGTGLSSYAAGNYIRAASSSSLEQRTPAQVLSDIGAASASHTHSASDITSGTLAVARGGTGISSYTTGNYIRAASSSSLEQRTPSQVLSDIGAAAASHTHTVSEVSGAVPDTRTISAGTGLTGGGDLTANRTLGLTGQALALHNLTGTGLMVRTGNATFATRSLTAGSNISISNADGVSGNPTIAVTGLAAVATSGSASDLTTGSLNLARLDQGGATTNQVLTWNGTQWAPQSPSGSGQSAIQFQDEGNNLGTAGTVDTVNFTGAGVTASRSGNVVTVNVAGGGGGGGGGGPVLPETLRRPFYYFPMERVGAGLTSSLNGSGYGVFVSNGSLLPQYVVDAAPMWVQFNKGSTASGFAQLYCGETANHGQGMRRFVVSASRAWNTEILFAVHTMPTSANDWLGRFGFTLGDPHLAATGGAFFWYDASQTEWVARTRNSAITDTNTGVSLTTSTVYKLRVRLTLTSAEFYIDDVLVATHTTNLPGSARFGAFVGLTGVAGTTAISNVIYTSEWLTYWEEL